ncbi:MAG: hypothetical protein F4078_04750 [Acidimicrobiia bacterium]|nr:hypothetical protein [Acidimicrobiia bacterium]MYB24466.1 hypothetical protein [Acidimicrobiia bacterium]MYJ13603.1 hypothetical protein [Acidimicrobiia bacterium]
MSRAAARAGSEAAVAVELVAGGEAEVLSRLVSESLSRLAGDADRALAVTELDEEDYTVSDGSLALSAVIDAAQTPPMLSDFRVVVARRLGVFPPSDLGPLLDYLAAPLETTRLLLVWEKGAAQSQNRPLPAALTDAVAAAGGVCHRAETGRGRAGRTWLTEQLAGARVRLDRAAADLLAEHLGEDRSRVWAVLDTLEGAYGTGAALGASDVAPFLGARGAVPPWELTDAIARGDIGGALACLKRLCSHEAMHPMQVMAMLRNHFDRMLHLDGAGARDEAAAAEVLRSAGLLRKGGSAFAARGALTASRKLGTAGIRRAIAMLAAADLDLRGATALELEVTLEVLVARLSQLHRR